MAADLVDAQDDEIEELEEALAKVRGTVETFCRDWTLSQQVKRPTAFLARHCALRMPSHSMVPRPARQRRTSAAFAKSSTRCENLTSLSRPPELALARRRRPGGASCRPAALSLLPPGGARHSACTLRALPSLRISLPACQATTATTATLRAMLAHLATPNPLSPLLASSSLSSSAASAASAPRESKSESKAKARRLARAFGQIPPEWTELERIDDRIEVYSHEDAVVFQNDHTTVLLGPVLAVPRDACPDAAPDIWCTKPHLASPSRLYDRSIPVAVKRTIKPSGAAQLQRALREKNVLMRLSHPHIVQARQAALLPATPLCLFRFALACDALSMTHA